jgi:predicted dehydrogenase
MSETTASGAFAHRPPPYRASMHTSTDTTPLRWGIAATGSIAASMCEALQTLPDADVVAVGSRTQDAADTFAERFGIPHAHGGYDALWADDDVDIVYVASPHSHHHAMTIAALDAGKHVVCEKAFAVNAAQAREMVEAARRNDRFLMEAMWTWFIPAVVDIRQRVLDGEIGELKVVEANFGIPVSIPTVDTDASTWPAAQCSTSASTRSPSPGSWRATRSRPRSPAPSATPASTPTSAAS